MARRFYMAFFALYAAYAWWRAFWGPEGQRLAGLYFAPALTFAAFILWYLPWYERRRVKALVAEALRKKEEFEVAEMRRRMESEG